MSCGPAHRTVAGLVVGVTIAYREHQQGESSAKPFVGAGLAALLGTLPDWIEPANHPNHRQFFHSIAFAAGLGYGGYKLYKWQPQEDWQKALRFIGLVGIGAYLVHLGMDATTPKSLPLV